MKKQTFKYISILFLSLSLGLTACTKQRVKNKALVLAVEKFDNEANQTAQAFFVDQSMQKVFVDFTRANSRLEVDSVELKGDNEATAQLTIETFPKQLVEELSTISGKEWKAKVDAAKQKKTYTLKLQKVDDVWKLVDQVENR